MSGRVFIKLDADTEDEASTEEEMETNVSDTDVYKNSEIKTKIEFKIDCKDQKKVNISNKSTNFVDFFDKDLDSTNYKRKKLSDTKMTKTDQIKFISNDLKDLKVYESCLDQMPSTSKTDLKTDFLELICDQSDGKSDDYSSKPQMKDQSTDSRYYCRSFKFNKDTETKPSSMTSDIKPTAPTPAPTIAQKIWVYICANCEERLKSKTDFCTHFDKKHSFQPNVPKKYRKLEESKLHPPIINTPIMRTDQPKTEQPFVHKQSDPIVPQPNSSLDRSKEKNKSSKSRSKLKSKSITSKATPVFSQQLSIESEALRKQPTKSNVHYQLVQKCKICSFTPLVDSLETIKIHIRTEHSDNKDIDICYTPVLVKSTPKNKKT